MNRSNKRPPTPDIDHRSTKRRKSYSDEDSVAYSSREITWDEQKKLPRRFHEHGEGFWPALRITRERGTGKKREYLIEWEPHPRTGEIFAPTWTPVHNVNTPLREEWEQRDRRESYSSDLLDSSPLSRTNTTKSRPKPISDTRRRNRRIISDSLDEVEESSSQRFSTGTPTRLLAAESPLSIDDSYTVEIAETQQPSLASLVDPDIKSSRSGGAQYDPIQSTPSVQPIISAKPGSKSVNSLCETAQVRSNTSPNSSYITSPSSARGDRVFQPRTSPRKRSNFPARILEYNSQIEVRPVTSYPQRPSSIQAEGEFVHESGPHYSRTIHPAQADDNFTLEDKHLSSAQQPLYSTSPHTLQPEPSLRVLPTSSTQHSKTSQDSQVFQSQIPLDSTSIASPKQYTRQKGTISNNMSARSTRQSPRLQVAVPNFPANSPRVAMRGSNARTKSAGAAPEISSPLAASAPEFPHGDSSLLHNNASSNPHANHVPDHDAKEQDLSTIQPANMHIEPLTQGENLPSIDSLPYDGASMQIQESIEEEPASSNEDGSLESKASSSQQSLEKEQLVRQQDGLIMPDFPILGPDEYCLALPAEGKVQAIYAQTIKVKRAAILRFIRRRGSVNLSGTSATKTIERNVMLELIQRLHDTTTHIDLGLPGIPTQYTIPSSEHAAYAEYAGSKFVFLGSLVDDLMRRDCTIAIMAQPATQDLLEEYLIMKHVNVNRYDRPNNTMRESQSQTTALTVELLSTKANDIVELKQKPVLVIALDASFESLGPQIKHMRAQSSGQLPVLHLIVTNSSEHVERCLPVSMPSPIRLKLLVRAAYQAHANLGGPTTYVEDPSDVPPGRPMDMLEFSKAIRKSPKRKMAMLAAIVANTALSDDFAANWTLKSMPELVLDELEETTPSSKESRATSVARRARSQTPVSRTVAQGRGRSQTPSSLAGTPNARKRLLDPDSANNLAKRPRMATLNEYVPAGETDGVQGKLEELERELDALRVELAAERQARQTAEMARASAEKRQHEWQSSLAQLQHRYEKRIKNSHKMSKDNKRLTLAAENGKQRIEKLNADNASLKSQLAETKASLTTARTDLKASGGEVAALEIAREESRIATNKATTVEKSLENTKRDFEFVRSQYQDASNRAAELASQVADLEKQNATLTIQASDEKRRLKELSMANSSAQHLAKISQLEQEKKQRDILLKRQEDELKMLKRNRGVQTRGSSVQPGSPGPRSRQASPAAGLLAPPGFAPPSGSRTSVLRHER